ncbi:quinone-dependent dihydroorotate dehydrogenase [Parvularcula marina]|uniref:quinone-dependent dihydroorotate dehydrogenase n=1 Tax=Parvularcula marina TaxID=2292771 RepID=UPI003514931C
MSIWRLGTRAFHAFDPETAHNLTIRALKAGVGPRRKGDLFPALETKVAGLTFPNPLGLAAGFDKNAVVPDACLNMGFGFVEVGAVTPRPQAGNDKPRVFRLSRDQAVINRYGFNNDGLEAIAARLSARSGRGIVGINLGANKDSTDRVGDYVTCAARLAPLVSFCTVNVSSPNTPGLRALQEKDVLMSLLNNVRMAMTGNAKLFLKIAPDLGDEDRADLVELAKAAPIDALVISNTTIGERDRLAHDPDQKGGLSGRPLFPLSTARLKEFAGALDGAVPLIGVGGISGAQDAYEKILGGASLVQIYTALVYKGPDLVIDILEGLSERLSADGFQDVADAVGKGL